MERGLSRYDGAFIVVSHDDRLDGHRVVIDTETHTVVAEY